MAGGRQRMMQASWGFSSAAGNAIDASAAFPAWWYLRMLPGLVVIVALAGSVQLFDSPAAQSIQKPRWSRMSGTGKIASLGCHNRLGRGSPAMGRFSARLATGSIEA